MRSWRIPMRSWKLRGFPGSSVSAILRLLAGPPGAQNHHDGEGAQDGEERAQKLVTFGNVTEEYVEGGHLLGVLISHPALGRDCESFRNRNLALGCDERQAREVEPIARPSKLQRRRTDLQICPYVAASSGGRRGGW